MQLNQNFTMGAQFTMKNVRWFCRFGVSFRGGCRVDKPPSTSFVDVLSALTCSTGIVSKSRANKFQLRHGSRPNKHCEAHKRIKVNDFETHRWIFLPEEFGTNALDFQTLQFHLSIHFMCTPMWNVCGCGTSSIWQVTNDDSECKSTKLLIMTNF